MNTTLQRILLFVTVTGLLCAGRTAQAQEPCVTNYTLVGPVGSELGTTTNGYPLLTVFVPLGQCATNIVYDEIRNDCTGSSTNHLEYTV
jgi:hypothetical protein